MEHRPVRCGAAAEMVPSDDALVALASSRPDDVDALMKLDLPAGVDVEIKAFGKEHK